MHMRSYVMSRPTVTFPFSFFSVFLPQQIGGHLRHPYRKTIIIPELSPVLLNFPWTFFLPSIVLFFICVILIRSYLLMHVSRINLGFFRLFVHSVICSYTVSTRYGTVVFMLCFFDILMCTYFYYSSLNDVAFYSAVTLTSIWVGIFRRAFLKPVKCHRKNLEKTKKTRLENLDLLLEFYFLLDPMEEDITLIQWIK